MADENLIYLRPVQRLSNFGIQLLCSDCGLNDTEAHTIYPISPPPYCNCFSVQSSEGTAYLPHNVHINLSICYSSRVDFCLLCMCIVYLVQGAL